MRKRVRRKLFYILLLIFIIAAPLLVAHSLGYTFYFSKLQVSKTGGIFIKSKIPRLAIFLNNIFLRRTSIFSGGALLTGIEPGTYLLRIEGAGFHPWSKAVTVEPAVVTELRGILLVKNPVTYATTSKADLAPFLADPPSSSDFLIDKKGNLIDKKTQHSIAANVNSFYVENGRNAILFVDNNGFIARFDMISTTTQIIGRPGIYLSREPIEFKKSPAGDMVLMDGSEGTFLLDTSDTITPLEGGVKKIYFDIGGEKALLVKEQSLEVLWLRDNRHQPFQKKFTREIILQVLKSTIRDARWYYLDNAHILLRTDEGIFFTELDGRGGRNTFELVSEKTEELLVFPEIPDAVFFQRGRVYYRIEI